ncbi:MAG: carboxypeptidase regulatory-like domain-containing protein [Planctomycetota bacterium]
MRPLTVLILILGALAALTFAVLSLSSNDVRGGGSATGSVVGPVVTPKADIQPRESANLAGPERVLPPVDRLAEEPTTRRIADPAAGEAWANTLVGVVRSPDGLPLEGVEVKLYSGRTNKALLAFRRMANGGAPDKPVREVRTGAEGLFQFRALQPGSSWMLTAEHGDFSFTEVGPITMPKSGTVQEDIELAVGYTVAGLVRDAETGKPLSEALVVLDDQLSINMPGGRPGPHYQEVRTKPDGSYAIRHLAPGTYSLICRKPDYATLLKTNIATLGDEDTVELDFEMGAGQVLAGRVVDGAGQGVEGATLDAISHNTTREQGMSRGNAVSGPDGEFLIDDVLAGMYTLTTQAIGFQSEPMHRVEAGNTNITVRVVRQGGVMGRAIDGVTGRPLSDFEVRVRLVNPKMPEASKRGRVVSQARVQSSSDGRFEVTGVPEGSYVVQGSAHGYANSFSGRFVVNEGQATPDVEVRMSKGGTLVGTVLDAKTRKPLKGVTVSTNDNNWIDSEFTNLLAGLNEPHVAHHTVRTDADGRFKIPLLSPEVYQVRIASEDHTVVTLNDINVVADSEHDMGVTMLSQGAEVAGTVYLVEGGVGKGISVYLHPADGSYQANRQTRTDAEGRFSIKNAPPGTYKLSASRPTQQGNPFQTIMDMTASEVEVLLIEGTKTPMNLTLGGE